MKPITCNNNQTTINYELDIELIKACVNFDRQNLEDMFQLPAPTMLESMYKKFKQFQEFDKLEIFDKQILDAFITTMEIDWTQSITCIQEQMTAKKETLVILTDNSEKSRYAVELAIDAVKEFKNLQPLLPSLTETINLINRQIKVISNLSDRARGAWFLSEIDHSSEQMISLEQLYANYKIYCTAHRETAVTKSVFRKDFIELANCFGLNPMKSRNKDGVYFRGVQFKPGIKLAPIVKK